MSDTTYGSFSSDQSCVPTHFASPVRKTGDELDNDIRYATNNEFINGLMAISNGMFAVLNGERQVIAVNDSFVKLLGINDPGEILGLRPGECVNCVHAHEMPGGCGTSEYCSTCGAVLSIIAAQETGMPQERTCALVIEKDRQRNDLYFSVRSNPIDINGSQFILLFLQDMSIQQQRACLDRTFFHDINNILCALVCKSEMLSLKIHPDKEKIEDLHQIALRIAQEIHIQNTLQKSLDASYKPLYGEVSAWSIVKEVERLFNDHPLTANRIFTVESQPQDTILVTDYHLVSRIIVNMVTNALEATPPGGVVRLTTGVEPGENALTFSVWNGGEIPEEVSLRIFQRNYSTKGTMGRGFGTYSMKLFGEQVLGGKVSFSSSEKEGGTIFKLSLPIRPIKKDGKLGDQQTVAQPGERQVL